MAPHENNATLLGDRADAHGKIARLPLALLQQLNQRLQNGELAQDLLSWLKQLPEVQAKRNSSASVRFSASVSSAPGAASENLLPPKPEPN